MVKLLRRRLLEGGHLAALRIDARHDMLDRAVLARGVHRLKHQQQRPSILGVEHILLFRKPLGALAEQFGGLAFVQGEATRVSRVEVL